MKTKLLLGLLLAGLAFGGMPVPMGDFTIYTGQTFYGEFDITDSNGPVGLTIESSPAGLIIGTPTITTVGTEGRKYVYPFSYTAATAGVKIFDIKATDSAGVAVSQQIKFTVKSNAPHVFTGCRQTVKPVVNNAWERFDVTWPVHYDANTYYIQMRETDGNIETNIYAQKK